MKLVLLLAAAVVALVAAVTALTPSGGSPTGEAASQPRVVSHLGMAQVQGQDVLVDVWVVVLPGQDEAAVAEAALRTQGALPVSQGDFGVAYYATNELLWDQFFDADPNNDYVVQHYNPAGDPTGGNGASALTNTHATWTDVATSSFAFQYGGTTSRCPSLVDECPGDQYFDGKNDVGWLPLSGIGILGVTWYGIGADEADMVLNTMTGWHAGSTACTDQVGMYDAQTVFLHENGHVAGLGHSDVVGATMYPYYAGAWCQLHQDDIDGISAIYPGGGGPPTPTPTPTPTVPPTPTPTSTPTATPTAGPDADGDGVSDGVDNCPLVPNPGQENADGAIGNGLGIPGHDQTVPNGDPADSEGDACETDGDIDNDGLADSEDTNPLGASGVCGAFVGSDDGHPNPAGADITNDDDGDGNPAPLMGSDAADNGPSWDSDNDGARDGIECSLGFDPRSSLSTPDETDCGGTGDSDGDGLLDAWETCKWGTDKTLADSDGDGMGDCVEAADVNGDGMVDLVKDAIYYAKASLMPTDAFGKDSDFDLNGDGMIDFVREVLQEAKFALIMGLCR